MTLREAQSILQQEVNKRVAAELLIKAIDEAAQSEEKIAVATERHAALLAAIVAAEKAAKDADSDYKKLFQKLEAEYVEKNKATKAKSQALDLKYAQIEMNHNEAVNKLKTEYDMIRATHLIQLEAERAQVEEDRRKLEQILIDLKLEIGAETERLEKTKQLRKELQNIK